METLEYPEQDPRPITPEITGLNPRIKWNIKEKIELKELKSRYDVNQAHDFMTRRQRLNRSIDEGFTRLTVPIKQRVSAVKPNLRRIEYELLVRLHNWGVRYF